MSDQFLEIKNLKKYFNTPRGVLHAVDNLSFTIPKGKTLGVVGESGCGKSTLGRALLMLDKPTEGQILYKGTDICTLKGRELKKMRPKIQMIFQDPYSSLNGRMSVRQLIEEPLIVNHICSSRKEMDEKIEHMMETVGLAPRLSGAYPHELDGGQRQRIGIARALILEPEFVVCDEPVSALDVSIQAQILNLLMDLQEKMKLTYLFITHDLSVVHHIADEIMVMYLGQCVEKGDADKIFTNPSHQYTKALLASIPIPEIASKHKKRELIRGEVVSPINPPMGCRFANRCPNSRPECNMKEIEFEKISEDHYAACIMCGEK